MFRGNGQVVRQITPAIIVISVSLISRRGCTIGGHLRAEAIYLNQSKSIWLLGHQIREAFAVTWVITWVVGRL